MSIPERFLLDNLVWTSTGDIWATWRLTPLQRPVTCLLYTSDAADE